MKYTFFLSLMFLLSGVTVVFAQQPVAPHLNYVTVDVETGNDIIYWYPSPSTEIDYYRISVRVVTAPGQPDSYSPIGSTPYPDTQYINTNSESGQHSVGYAVYGVDVGSGPPMPINVGGYDRIDSTVFLQSVFDSCQATISLTWTDYNSWRGSTSNYNLMQRISAGVYQLISPVTYGTNSYVLTNVQVNQNYDLFIEAVNTDGRISRSNRVNVYTLLSARPVHINADFATISSENTIDLSFTVNTLPGLTDYSLMRSASETGPFTLVTDFSSSDSIIRYTDNVSFQSGIYYYRLDALNTCGSASVGSNLANNVILNGNITNRNVSLAWNEYVDWLGGVENYSVIRILGQEDPIIDTLVVGNSLTLNQDLSTLLDYMNPSSSLICYQVKATEGTNSLGKRGFSYSNRVCFTLTPDIRMPNAFIPNDGDAVNRYFEPVFSFLPEHYDLIIYNRLGTMIWEGSGPWDGKVNGNFVPEGVYVYLLRVYNYSSSVSDISGSVTVVYR